MGWGHSTFWPSRDNLSFDATASPNSILASLHWWRSEKKSIRGKQDVLGVNDQAPGISLVERGEVNLLIARVDAQTASGAARALLDVV